MTVLVTGAASPLGRLFVPWLRTRRGEDVVATARRTGTNPELNICDVCVREQLASTLDAVRPSLIFHLAARYSGNLDSDLSVNAWSARTLLELLGEQEFSARLVLLGSAAEYGLVNPAENPVPESRRLAPMSIYGLTKAFQTQVGSYFASVHGRDVVVARLFNLYAPGLPDRLFVGRVQRMIDAIKQGTRDRFMVGNLESVRDYVSAEQAFEQLSAIADRGLAGEIYHVASGVPTSMRDLLDRMLREAGLDWGAVESSASHAPRAGCDVPVIYADVRKTIALQPEDTTR
ncbi:NAD-dependent epimerase/dehydratase family protein [Thiocapsa marina]|uniref:NAD-dependent epimerase/dehydratase n=1 Tax=Thiocapsa marina 5811 TaxID=768671 RepID=F9U6Y7_9GAMM|nr:NAD-dependent epimerase/dehydratase family protein [Thiocapsa marina]EGV20013.1 NAD-dependent epimerase/dehydratase [Thiocapsa marina 5811]